MHQNITPASLEDEQAIQYISDLLLVSTGQKAWSAARQLFVNGYSKY